jgi:NAD(P)-dependent dehydrogenase (short-subunit alcohol dehydrogenase family)
MEIRESVALVTGANRGISASSVAEQTMQALANDSAEVLADERTRQVKAALSQSPDGSH